MQVSAPYIRKEQVAIGNDNQLSIKCIGKLLIERDECRY